MTNTMKMYKKMNCSVLNKEVKIEFQDTVIDDQPIGSPHMTDCNQINTCDVVETDPSGIKTFHRDRCPIQTQYQ